MEPPSERTIGAAIPADSALIMSLCHQTQYPHFKWQGIKKGKSYAHSPSAMSVSQE
ncbi:hypothetical protein yrohd0001_29630 [Yersinia rohdei ATCC 43380]|nr:hypothetical protein yrohd0001_29630 [Yersinia rohdei ATCC 43380]